MTKITSRLLALLAGAASALACLSGSVLARQTTKPENGSAPATPAPTPLPAPAALAASAIATAEPAQAQDLAFAQNLSRAFRSVASTAGPSVVHITQLNSVVERRDFQGRGQVQMRPTGLGSGVIFSADGLILTNNHVIQINNRAAEQLVVKLASGKEYPAKLVGRDPSTDLAVIRIDGFEGSELPAAKFADSDALEVGDWVVAIGSPFGLSNTVTAGIVSAKGRPLNGNEEGRIEDFIQTDAAINPGNSGGPLLNLNGEIVGINTAIASRTGGYEGIGFAVPSTLAKAVVQNILKNGRMVRGYLGVNLAEGSQDGVLVQSVLDDGPAASAGLKPGDIIRAFEGRRLDLTRLRQSIAVTPPGTPVKLEVVRDGKPMQVTATLADLNAATSAINAARASELGMSYVADLGAYFKSYTRDDAKRANAAVRREGGRYLNPTPAGVRIEGVENGKQADVIGFRAGDIVVEMDGKPVTSAEQLAKAIESKRGDSYTIKIWRGGQYWTGEVGE